MIKKFYFAPAICLMLGLAASSCTDFDWDEDHDTTLTEFDVISSDISVDITGADSDLDATHLIEWSSSKAADYTQVFYKVLFSPVGDFANPTYTLEPERIGTATSLELTNRTLNIIAEASGIEQKASGTIKWAVQATNGIATRMSESVHTLDVKRPGGFASIPLTVTIKNAVGEAVELKPLAEGVFEGYVSLGVDDVQIKESGSTAFYGIDGNKLVKGLGFTAVKPGQIHYLKVDFNTAEASIFAVEKMELWYSCANDVVATLSPDPSGVALWSGNYLFNMVDNDVSYKFRMTKLSADGQTSETFLGSTAKNPRPQTGSSAPSYFYLVEEEVPSQSDYCFGFNKNTHDGKTLVLTVDLRPQTENYTHSVAVL